MKPIALLVFYFLAIYLISRKVINELYFFLKKIVKKEKLVFLLISLLFFPGTVVHELSHFFAATILFLPVKEIRIFPSFEDNKIRLGSVYYVKKDFFRGILVGVAPVLVGFIVLWVISHFPLNIFSYYLVFTVSSTMFSSKKDLEDLIYLLPLLLIIGALVYIFHIDISFFINKVFSFDLLISFLERVNQYLVISLFINVFIFGILKLLTKVLFGY